jgi:hypothetical protein
VRASGTVVGVTHWNEPADGVADPPDSVDEDNVWPYVIALAAGGAVTIAIAGCAVTVAAVDVALL